MSGILAFLISISFSCVTAVNYDMLFAFACQKQVEHFHSILHLMEQKFEHTTLNKTNNQYFKSVKRNWHICYESI